MQGWTWVVSYAAYTSDFTVTEVVYGILGRRSKFLGVADCAALAAASGLRRWRLSAALGSRKRAVLWVLLVSVIVQVVVMVALAAAVLDGHGWSVGVVLGRRPPGVGRTRNRQRLAAVRLRQPRRCPPRRRGRPGAVASCAGSLAGSTAVVAVLLVLTAAPMAVYAAHPGVAGTRLA